MRSGDGEESFESFVRAHEASMFGQAYLLCGQHEEAQDLVQEAFARAWHNWSRVESYDDPRAWVRRVLHNLAVSRWRHLRHPAAAGGGTTHVPAVGAAEPDAGHVDVAAALARLPARQRMALVLYAIDDLTVPEVAAEMNVPQGTVRAWLSRARTTLATDLGFERVGHHGHGRGAM